MGFIRKGITTLLLLAILVPAGRAEAAPIVTTDSSWLTTNTVPADGWNTALVFDTTDWINASEYLTAECIASAGAGCIWYDSQFSGTQTAWFRKTFTVAGPVSSAFLQGGIDDDVTIWINGTTVYNDMNGFAQNFGPIDVTSFLQPGLNLIAAVGWDNFQAFGQNHAFAAFVDAQSVPEPSTLLLATGGALLVARRRTAAGSRRRD